MEGLEPSPVLTEQMFSFQHGANQSHLKLQQAELTPRVKNKETVIFVSEEEEEQELEIPSEDTAIQKTSLSERRGPSFHQNDQNIISQPQPRLINVGGSSPTSKQKQLTLPISLAETRRSGQIYLRTPSKGFKKATQYTGQEALEEMQTKPTSNRGKVNSRSQMTSPADVQIQIESIKPQQSSRQDSSLRNTFHDSRPLQKSPEISRQNIKSLKGMSSTQASTNFSHIARTSTQKRFQGEEKFHSVMQSPAYMRQSHEIDMRNFNTNRTVRGYTSYGSKQNMEELKREIEHKMGKVKHMNNQIEKLRKLVMTRQLHSQNLKTKIGQKRQATEKLRLEVNFISQVQFRSRQ